MAVLLILLFVTDWLQLLFLVMASSKALPDIRKTETAEISPTVAGVCETRLL